MQDQDQYTLKLDLNAPQIGASPMLYGLFYEDINFAGDGGIYGELLKNRSFEYFDSKGLTDKRLMGWEKVQGGNSIIELGVLYDNPLNGNNSNYLHIDVIKAEGNAGIKNLGFNDTGFAVTAFDKYYFSMYARTMSEGPRVTARAVVQNPDTGEVYGEAFLEIQNNHWQKYETVIQANHTYTNAVLLLLFTEEIRLDVDMVSLFPQKTFHNRRNGLRADLVQMLKDLKPSFLRFPGGCIVEGRSFENMFRWKDTLGDVSERKLNWNRWQLAEYQLPNQNSDEYFQSYGLGFYEYFLLCEDIGAEPVPVLNAGMTCQWHEGLLVPMEELAPYIQDALDLIEYANGDETTTWGKKRMGAGHPQPFHLKYIGIGNEQWGAVYFERYEVFHKAIKSKYPEINIITSAGWRSEGEEFTEAYEWMKNNKEKAEIVDEHFYQTTNWFIDNIHRYDDYDRSLPKVFAGEYAAHTSPTTQDRRGNWEAALSEAAFLIGVEKNSDHVWMASYAPLLAKTGYNQWQPNLIWFNNSEVYGTPSYYVQQVFGTNRCDSILQSEVSIVPSSGEPNREENGPFPNKDNLFMVSGYAKATNEIIIKVVNLSSEAQRASLELSGVRRLSPVGVAITLVAGLEDENSYENPRKVSPIVKEFHGVNISFAYEFESYSLTILRLQVQE